MPDPFDAVTPIGGQGGRPAQLRISGREAKMRATANRVTPQGPAVLKSTDATTGQPKVPKGRRRGTLRPTMTVDEAMAMAERMARQAYREATNPETKGVNQKYAATKFGVALDKWTMLSGRPTQIHEIREERAGLKALALRVLQGGAGTPGAPA